MRLLNCKICSCRRYHFSRQIMLIATQVIVSGESGHFPCSKSLFLFKVSGSHVYDANLRSLRPLETNFGVSCLLCGYFGYTFLRASILLFDHRENGSNHEFHIHQVSLFGQKRAPAEIGGGCHLSLSLGRWVALGWSVLYSTHQIFREHSAIR